MSGRVAAVTAGGACRPPGAWAGRWTAASAGILVPQGDLVIPVAFDTGELREICSPGSRPRAPETGQGCGRRYSRPRATVMYQGRERSHARLHAIVMNRRSPRVRAWAAQMRHLADVITVPGLRGEVPRRRPSGHRKGMRKVSELPHEAKVSEFRNMVTYYTSRREVSCFPSRGAGATVGGRGPAAGEPARAQEAADPGGDLRRGAAAVR
jgi:hypothetical protein